MGPLEGVKFYTQAKKKPNTQQLHSDTRAFCIYVKIRAQNTPQQNKSDKDPFSIKKPTPERVCHKTLDTFLHRIRTELLDESKHIYLNKTKQKKTEWVISIKQTNPKWNYCD